MNARRAPSAAGGGPRWPGSGPGAVLKVGHTEGHAIDPSDVERFVHLAGRDRAVIVILSSAAENPAQTGADATAQCRRFGAEEVVWLQVWQRGDANSAPAVAQLERATGILLVGGDSGRWHRLLAGTRVQEAIHRRHAAGAVVAASGAGLLLMPPEVVAALDLVEVDLGLLAEATADSSAGWRGF